MKAAYAAYTTFTEEALIPDERWGWGDYPNRAMRYRLYEGLYHNVAYRQIETYSAVMKHDYDLYKHIRGIYNPVYRLVELIVAKTMGGALDWDGLETGALILTRADPALTEAILQVMQWSNWQTRKSLFARQMTTLGDGFLWIDDDPMRGKVRIEPLHAAKLKAATFDGVGNIKAACIEYEREWMPDGGELKNGTYRMDVDKERFATFKDDEPFSWTDTGLAEWPNEYGFVPLAHGPFKDEGLMWGANCFHTALSKIHEINDAASILNDNIRKANNITWYLAGTQAGQTLKFSGNLADGTTVSDPSAQRDKVNTLHGPAGSQPHAMHFPLDIANTGLNIQNLLMELERDMPELTMQRIRDGNSGLSGVAIRNMYGDAVGRLDEAAGNLDDVLIRALQMAVAMGGYRGYDGFGPFNLESYDRGDLDFNIKERQHFEDKLTPQERLQAMQALPENAELARYILESELEMPADVVDAIINAEAETQERQARAAARGLADRLFGPQDDESEDDDEIEGQTIPALTAPQGPPTANGNR